MSEYDSHQRLSGSRIVNRTIRPPRVAFVIQNVEHCDFIIDVCSLTWGGKNFLIVPYDESLGLTDEWWRMLIAYDPDWVINLCDLDESTGSQLLDLITFGASS